MSAIRVLHIATSDGMGGAGRVASDLVSFQRATSIDASLAVRLKRTSAEFVVTIDEPRHTGPWYRALRRMRDSASEAVGAIPVARRAEPILRRSLGALADPRGAVAYAMGRDDFAFSSTRRLPAAFAPDLIHCHNLHGNYFDLTALPELSARMPTMLTMHDCWLLAGHCGQPMGCERWKTGCGQCPDLTIPPAVGRDATAFNWRRKARIFQQSRLYLALPAQWLVPRVEASMLAPAVVESRVIPHGVDLDVFSPGEPLAARRALGLPVDGLVLLMSAFGGRDNPFKDVATLERALDALATPDVTAIVLGESGPRRQRGRVRVVPVPFLEDIPRLVQYYRASDVYVHASRAETLPLSIIEALACGLPVVASAVGGVPELVWSTTDNPRHPTGTLVAAHDAGALTGAIDRLLSDDAFRASLGANARRDSEDRFDIRKQGQRYTEWYDEILQHQAF